MDIHTAAVTTPPGKEIVAGFEFRHILQPSDASGHFYPTPIDSRTHALGVYEARRAVKPLAPEYLRQRLIATLVAQRALDSEIELVVVETIGQTAVSGARIDPPDLLRDLFVGLSYPGNPAKSMTEFPQWTLVNFGHTPCYPTESLDQFGDHLTPQCDSSGLDKLSGVSTGAAKNLSSIDEIHYRGAGFDRPTADSAAPPVRARGTSSDVNPWSPRAVTHRERVGNALAPRAQCQVFARVEPVDHRRIADKPEKAGTICNFDRNSAPEAAMRGAE
ncbi:hypothetical protein AB0C34_16170 [Nocardia sp. NPDC049220]|uniref:hypothetical protein n=1 Tax=Nocardia sp. NPDC049220 TaxID=3155273 RepID=UPI0033E2698D